MNGERVGSYVITQLLGQGGMGAVYLAQHELLDRPAAIKMLLPALSADPDVVARFFDEARATTSIADPGIVQIFDFGYHTDGRAYLVMEYLEGETLDVRIEGGGWLAPQRALRIARQIATSLDAAHARGVIHRDLKLENVFLVHDPVVPGGERAKILDFGIAKLQRNDGVPRSRTRTGAIMGTPLYMSPEQCRDSHEIDGRSDVYALGCLLFCMVTGRPPFDYESAGEIIAAHLKEDAPTPSSVKPDLPFPWAVHLDAIVGRCLAKEREDRYAGMGELSRAIAEVLEEPSGAVALARSATLRAPSTLARPTTLSSALGETLPPGSELPELPRRRSWGTAFTAMALAVLLIGGAALAMRRPTAADAADTAGGEPAALVPTAAAATAATAVATPIPVAVPAPVVLVPVPAPPVAPAPIAAEPAAAPVVAPTKSSSTRRPPPRRKAAAHRGDHVRTSTSHDDDRPDDVDRGD
jgi:serine/threonine-protein kinase